MLMVTWLTLGEAGTGFYGSAKPAPDGHFYPDIRSNAGA